MLPGSITVTRLNCHTPERQNPARCLVCHRRLVSRTRWTRNAWTIQEEHNADVLERWHGTTPTGNTDELSHLEPGESQKERRRYWFQQQVKLLHFVTQTPQSRIASNKAVEWSRSTFSVGNHDDDDDDTTGEDHRFQAFSIRVRAQLNEKKL